MGSQPPGDLSNAAVSVAYSVTGIPSAVSSPLPDLASSATLAPSVP
jgi:hypothetical protein